MTHRPDLYRRKGVLCSSSRQSNGSALRVARRRHTVGVVLAQYTSSTQHE